MAVMLVLLLVGAGGPGAAVLFGCGFAGGATTRRAAVGIAWSTFSQQRSGLGWKKNGEGKGPARGEEKRIGGACHWLPVECLRRPGLAHAGGEERARPGPISEQSHPPGGETSWGSRGHLCHSSGRPGGPFSGWPTPHAGTANAAVG